MLKKLMIVLFFIYPRSANVNGCPCCVGEVTENSPPFFFDSCYEEVQEVFNPFDENKSSVS